MLACMELCRARLLRRTAVHGKALIRTPPLLPNPRIAQLAQERIYSPDQTQYWANLVQLLFAGAEACDRVLREKASGMIERQSIRRTSQLSPSGATIPCRGTSPSSPHL